MLRRNKYSGKWISLGIALSCFLFFNPAYVKAQKTPFSPPENSQPTLTFEEKHQDKSFLCLVYEMELELKEDWSYIIRRHERIKILKEDARDMGEMPVCYTKGQDEVIDIKAFTLTPDGKKHRYTKIQDINVYAGYKMYSDSMVKIITLPQANVGSILDYETTVLSRPKLIPNNFWDNYTFDFSTPTKEFNGRFTWPKKLNVQYRRVNLQHAPQITETESTITYSWHLENVYNEQKDKDFLPPPTLASIKNAIEISSLKTWAEVSAWYYQLIQKDIIINSEIEDTVNQLIKDKTTVRQKTKAILEYIQDNFRYVSMSFGNNILEPHPTDEVFHNRYGDCKDLSLLCLAMLKLAGIKSNIAFFAAEYDSYNPQDCLPSPSTFDHVVLLVEDKEVGDFYLDPTLQDFDIAEYPLDYQRAYTFIITEDSGRFDRFPEFDEKRVYAQRKQIINIEEDGSADIEGWILWEPEVSRDVRQKVKAMDEKERSRFFNTIDNIVTSGGEMFERRFEGLEARYGPLKSYARFRRPQTYRIIHDIIIIDLINFSRDRDFAEDERENPIFFPANSLEENEYIYRAPKGYYISHGPEDVDLDIGFFSYKREYQKKFDQITYKEVARYRRCQLPRDDYPKVKDFFDRLPQKTKQYIVLKKIKPWWQEIKEVFLRLKDKR